MQQHFGLFTFCNASRDLRQMCAPTLILSYTAAAFSGSLLWCRKANSVSTIPGDMHCREGKCIGKTFTFAAHTPTVWGKAE